MKFFSPKELPAGLLLIVAAIGVLLLVDFPRSSTAQTTTGADPKPDLTFAVIYRQANLISDLPGVAFVEDPLLKDPWGIALPSFGPFVVANDASGFATAYRGDIRGVSRDPSQASVFIEPSPGMTGATQPAAVVNNPTSDFQMTVANSPPTPARFIFVTLNGNINGWSSSFGSSAPVARSLPGHAYTGVAIGSNASGNLLYAADFLNGTINVFDKDFNLTTVTGGFADVSVPASYHPFNVQNLGGSLYITYAEFNQFSNRPNSGSGKGYVRKFDADGVRDSSFAISGGVLDAPWGIVIAPSGSGGFSGDFIVGNYGSSGPLEPSLSAFNPATGALLGSMIDAAGSYLKIDRLWGLVFGTGLNHNGGDANTLYFTAGIFGEQHGLFGSLTPVTGSPPPTIKFSSTDYFVSENAGHIDITVTLSGIFGTPISVNYATVNGGAIQGVDYEMALGKLTFQPGETTKTFRVLIIDNHQSAGGSTRDLSLVLSNPAGAGADLVSPRIARLAIMDDEGDTPGQPPNTSDDPQLFVRQQYFDFLNREPDPSGFNFWVNNITSCGGDPQCIEVKRINVSAAFFLSIEFQNTGMLAYLAHVVAGEVPRYGEFMREVQQLQKNYVFGAPGAEAQLEANKQQFFNDFVERPEFKSRLARNEIDLYGNAGISGTIGNVYIAPLTGDQQVPPSGSPAKGVAVLRFPLTGGPTAFLTLDFSGLTSAETAAHIHGPAPAGSEAPVVFSLPNDQFGNFPITMTVPQHNALGDGKFYIDVHTANFPGGEIRGQIPFTQFIFDVLNKSRNDGTITFAQEIRIIVECKEASADDLNRAFVLMQYFGYLRRNPDDLPDHDFSGYNFWLDKLNAFNGDFVASEMVKAFLTSTEYRSRFGPP